MEETLLLWWGKPVRRFSVFMCNGLTQYVCKDIFTKVQCQNPDHALPGFKRPMAFLIFCITSLPETQGLRIPKAQSVSTGRTADDRMWLWATQQQKTYLKFLLKLFDFHNFQVTLFIQNF